MVPRPHLGVNAIEKMAKLVDRLNSIPLEREHPLLGKPTLSIGTIRGGTKINIVPDRCEIEVDRRMLPGEKKEEVLGEMKEILDSLQLQDPLFQYRMEEIDFAEPSEVNPEEEIVRTGCGGHPGGDRKEATAESILRVHGFPFLYQPMSHPDSHLWAGRDGSDPIQRMSQWRWTPWSMLPTSMH